QRGAALAPHDRGAGAAGLGGGKPEGRREGRGAAADQPRQRRRLRGRAFARRLGDSAPARVHGQTAAAATPARAAVELHRRVAELAAEAERAANEAAVEHHAGAESGARRQHHERADTAAGAEEELTERETV